MIVKSGFYLFPVTIISILILCISKNLQSQVISGNNFHSLFLCTNKTVWSCGLNNEGELGDGTNISKNFPVPILSLSNVKAISAGQNFSMFLKDDESVWTCGWNGFGQLGIGTNDSMNVPVQIPSLSSIAAIVAGSNHSLFLKNDGTVWACGFNGPGCLGDGTGLHSNVPVKVLNVSNIIAVTAGYNESYFLKDDGTVWACGTNIYGQLGNPASTGENSPVQIPSLYDVSSIVAGGSGYCYFLKNDGTVWVCGHNKYGQLGDGTNIDKSTPIQIPSLTNVKNIVAGYDHSFFLKNDGTVWACGWNKYGQLADGTTIDKNIPVQIPFLSNVSDIAAGVYHSIFLMKDGSTWSCGRNNWGQLGDETNTDRYNPVQITVCSSSLPPKVTTNGAILCGNPCDTLNATVKYGASPLTYSWAPGGQTTSSVIVCPTFSTIYTVTVTDSKGITATDTAMVIVSEQPNVVLSDTTICYGSNLVLNAGGFYPATYQWSTGASTQSIVVSTPGSYSVTVSNVCGSTSGIMELKQLMPPSISLGKDTNTCKPISLIPVTVNANSYLWSTGSTNKQITVSQTGTYWVTASNDCGKVTDTIKVNPGKVPYFLFKDTVVCAGKPVTIDLTGAGIDFLWSDNSSNSSFTISQTGIYWVQVINVQGCAKKDTMQVTQGILPFIKACNDTVVCPNEPAMLSATSNVAYMWSNGIKDQSITVIMPGEYIVYTTGIGTCGAAKDTVVLSNKECKCHLELPTAFSPNDDGANDILYARGDCNDFILRIFDRWGEKVFETNNILKGWDGYFKGAKMNSGVFTYYLIMNAAQKDKEVKKGNFSLIR